MDPKFQEGWFTDPYGLHEARWLSNGTATALVRDAGVEGSDPAPTGPATIDPQPIEVDLNVSAGEEMRRADDSKGDQESEAALVYDAETGDIASLNFPPRT